MNAFMVFLPPFYQTWDETFFLDSVSSLSAEGVKPVFLAVAAFVYGIAGIVLWIIDWRRGRCGYFSGIVIQIAGIMLLIAVIGFLSLMMPFIFLYYPAPLISELVSIYPIVENGLEPIPTLMRVAFGCSIAFFVIGVFNLWATWRRKRWLREQASMEVVAA